MFLGFMELSSQNFLKMNVVCISEVQRSVWP